MDEEDFDALELRLMCAFLEDAAPVEWLTVALTMNYDGKADLIAWMAAHPKMDRATAVALYWRMQPGYYQRYGTEQDVPDDWRLTNWRVIHALQERVVSGTVAAAGAAFDPAWDPSPTGDPLKGYDWTVEALTGENGAAWPIPAPMLEAVSGAEVDICGYADTHGWDEGMPPPVLAALEAAYEQEKKG